MIVEVVEWEISNSIDFSSIEDANKFLKDKISYWDTSRECKLIEQKEQLSNSNA